MKNRQSENKKQLIRQSEIDSRGQMSVLFSG
jgi:hypothetical protein